MVTVTIKAAATAAAVVAEKNNKFPSNKKRGRLTSLDGLFCYIVSKLPFIIIETS